MTKDFKEMLKRDCLGLEDKPIIKKEIKTKNGYAIPVILDNGKEVYFLTDNNFMLNSLWYYEKENVILN